MANPNETIGSAGEDASSENVDEIDDLNSRLKTMEQMMNNFQLQQQEVKDINQHIEQQRIKDAKNTFNFWSSIAINYIDRDVYQTAMSWEELVSTLLAHTNVVRHNLTALKKLIDYKPQVDTTLANVVEQVFRLDGKIHGFGTLAILLQKFTSLLEIHFAITFDIESFSSYSKVSQIREALSRYNLETIRVSKDYPDALKPISTF